MTLLNTINLTGISIIKALIIIISIFSIYYTNVSNLVKSDAVLYEKTIKIAFNTAFLISFIIFII